MSVVKSIKLFFQEGTSDKVYYATILDDGGTYTVAVEWGRRGSKLNTGNKAVKVALAQAEKVYARLVREKTNKGYQEVTDDVQPAAVAPPVGQGSGSRVGGRRKSMGRAAQLLLAMEEDELESMLSNDKVIAQ